MTGYDLAIGFLLVSIGFVLGSFVTHFIIDKVASKCIKSGRFIITKNDPTKDLVTIDLDIDLPDIEKSKALVFEVVINDDKPV